MLKKILMLGASALLATAATNAMAGSPSYPVAPVNGSIKIVRAEGQQNGSSKVFKESVSAKTLIRVAMGSDGDTPVDGEKNLSLGLALGQDCGAEVVVWDKTANEGDGAIVGELAFINSCPGNDVEAYPAEGSAGTYKDYFTTEITFVPYSSSTSGCGALAKSSISGNAVATGLYLEKDTANGDYIPVSVSLSGLIGNIGSEDDNVVVTGGAFKANLAPAKALGSSSAAIYMTCAP